MNELLRALVDARDRQIQKARIQFGNRIDAIMRESDTANAEQLEILRRYYAAFYKLEREIDRDIAEMVSKEAIYDVLTSIRGIGPSLAAKLLAMIDIERADTISALWRYAGYGVVDGKCERPHKGEVLHYNKRLKATCFLIASSFLNCNSPYRRIYDEAKEFYQIHRADWTRGHQHMAAMRKMIKVFLSHLWLRMREIEGLSITRPYVIDVLGHASMYLPEEFGW